MISACYARLVSLIAGIRLQVLLPGEFSETDCVEWAANVRDATSKHKIAADVAPILDRLGKEPEFAVQYLRWTAATSGIITFTSGVEYFLQDLVHLCLRRNTGLRKGAFAQHKIPALELEEFQIMDQIKLRHIDIIANDNTSGPLFSHKYRKSSRFLDIPNEHLDSSIRESLDSIWNLRNRFAHENHEAIKELRVKNSTGDFVLTRSANKSEYTQFAISLVEVIGTAAHSLEGFDKLALDKWPADAFIHDA